MVDGVGSMFAIVRYVSCVLSVEMARASSGDLLGPFCNVGGVLMGTCSRC